MGQPHTSWASSRDQEGWRSSLDLPNRKVLLALAGVLQLFQTFAVILRVLAPFLPLHVPHWRSFQGRQLGGANIHDTGGANMHDTRCLHIFPTVISRTSEPFNSRDTHTAASPREGAVFSLPLLNWQIYFLNLQILKNITKILLGDPEDHSVLLLAMSALLGCSPSSQEGARSWGVFPKQGSLLPWAWDGVSRENEGQVSENSMFPLQCHHSRSP